MKTIPIASKAAGKACILKLRVERREQRIELLDHHRMLNPLRGGDEVREDDAVHADANSVAIVAGKDMHALRCRRRRRGSYIPVPSAIPRHSRFTSVRPRKRGIMSVMEFELRCASSVRKVPPAVHTTYCHPPVISSSASSRSCGVVIFRLRSSPARATPTRRQVQVIAGRP